jgi:signal transduction histidine kinase
MILDPKGKVLAHNAITEVGNLYRDETAHKSITSWETLLQYPFESILDISTPLAISTKRWGTLRIGISLETLSKEISGLIWKYIVYTAGFILIAIALVSLLSGVIIKPLRLLSREMDETKPGDDPPQFPSPREDEIGTLEKSFHRLLKRVKEDEKEKERTQRNLLLTEKMVAIGKLTSGVAHEINNPLGGILNCIYHFKKGQQPVEKQQQYLDLMEDGIKRIQKAVTNLLEYARNPNLERSDADLGTLIDKALNLLGYQIRKNQIKIERDIPKTIPSVKVDWNQMDQVFVNIFLNAIQAMQEGGTLKVALKTNDDRVKVTISDTGKGIREEDLSKVFDPFFTTKGEDGGTGLGLWISQGVIERHGGSIRIKSGENEGTTVIMDLPLQVT